MSSKHHGHPTTPFLGVSTRRHHGSLTAWKRLRRQDLSRIPPLITTLRVCSQMLLTHTHEEFASLADFHTCTWNTLYMSCIWNVSRVALLRPSQIQRYVYGGWQGTLEIQECLCGKFKIIQLDTVISLLQKPGDRPNLLSWESPHQVDPLSPLPPTRGSHTCKHPHLMWPVAQRCRALRHVLHMPGVLVQPRPSNG